MGFTASDLPGHGVQSTILLPRSKHTPILSIMYLLDNHYQDSLVFILKLSY